MQKTKTLPEEIEAAFNAGLTSSMLWAGANVSPLTIDNAYAGMPMPQQVEVRIRDTIQRLLGLRDSTELVNAATEPSSVSLSSPEPPPTQNAHPAVWDLVLRDMQERDHSGFQKYGTRLQPHNGRNALVDAYQEVLDLAVYLRQEIYELDGK